MYNFKRVLCEHDGHSFGDVLTRTYSEKFNVHLFGDVPEHDVNFIKKV